jgi:hypothetical protein
LGNSWFSNEDATYMDMIPNLTLASASALSSGNWGANFTSNDYRLYTDSAVVIDGGGNAWATNGSTDLVEYSSTNATMDYTSPTASAAILSPLLSSSSIFGYNATDPSAYASGRTGGTWALMSGGNAQTVPGVDASGNLWVIGPAEDFSTHYFHGAQLTTFVGIAAPAQTPLASALVTGGLGAKP